MLGKKIKKNLIMKPTFFHYILNRDSFLLLMVNALNIALQLDIFFQLQNIAKNVMKAV